MTVSVLVVNATAFKGVFGPRLSARQARGHHRILVIRLVDSVWGGNTEETRRALPRPTEKK
jgi:hypothetical protein